ncbi:cysteine-rich venom protein 6-like [Armigeres subalbatus]|uniref:cysteine-rich venom protein 6-like n=1 Tax=Armigeres subalbatus TaxID=124917 RepID=UPI002ED6684B
MRSILVATLMSVALFVTSFGKPHCCDENKVFTECGSACPETCETIEHKEPEPCPEICVPGCFCREGFVLDPDNKCVEPVDCPNNATTYAY